MRQGIRVSKIRRNDKRSFQAGFAGRLALLTKGCKQSRAFSEGREQGKLMTAPATTSVALSQTNVPVIETGRLILRGWRESDIEPNTAMLADPASGRFITSDGKPVTEAFVGWRNAAVMAGHWALHGFGLFVVEEKQTGRYVGRVGPWLPPSWPGFEIGWGIASGFRGKGYAVEAASASIDWAFARFEIDRIIHCIDRENVASQSVARRLGAVIEGEFDLFGHVADVWVTHREAWMARPKP
jgi:RimJ/RimL family protein N-acetyltransferase